MKIIDINNNALSYWDHVDKKKIKRLKYQRDNSDQAISCSELVEENCCGTWGQGGTQQVALTNCSCCGVGVYLFTGECYPC